MNFFILFLTGLTTGGLSCLAVQGGLLASAISNQKKQERDAKTHSAPRSDFHNWTAVALFLIAKLLSHIVLGFLLGWFGSQMTLRLEVKLFFQALTSLFMFASAMNLLNIHPAFRFLAFQPPTWIRKMLKNNTHSETFFAPFILGAMTIFIPCGVTQAVELVAINTASPWLGALTMGVFVLGTLPLFTIVGIATAKLSDTWHQYFTKVTATILIFMALYSFNGVLTVLNSPLSFQNLTRPVRFFFSDERFQKNTNSLVKIEDGVQKITVNATNQGYSPQFFQVKKGVPVQLTLNSSNTYSCALSFVFKDFSLYTLLEPTDEKTFDFTPTKTGKFMFSCSMGMYSGIMEVL